MNYTDPWGIPFPDGEDTGATALYLQHLAERAEAALGVPYAKTFHQFTHGSPIIIKSNASAQSYPNEPLSTAEAHTGNGNITTDTMVYTNTTEFQPGNYIYLYRRGVWLVGTAVTAQAVGAVNVGTYRMARVYAEYFDGDFVEEDLQRFDDWQPSANNGGESFSVEGLLVLPDTVVGSQETPADAVRLAELQAQFYHGNTSSNMQINAGNCKLWAVWLGDTSIIQGA